MKVLNSAAVLKQPQTVHGDGRGRGPQMGRGRTGLWPMLLTPGLEKEGQRITQLHSCEVKSFEKDTSGRPWSPTSLVDSLSELCVRGPTTRAQL